ncbi:MAG: polysaccharide lyase 11 [Planctomycetes bacterium]|nr:polysaccharide lyase 11 [Planctomycetota bacterium]
MHLTRLMTMNLGSPAGQCRAAPVDLGPGRPGAVLAAWAADFDVDPYSEMFFFPTDTLKLALFTTDGDLLWRRDLGRAVVPGLWFCPVFPFDLDGDGVDEIWLVNNVNTLHPLGLSGYRLERLDAATGQTTGQWPWPAWPESRLSHTFRNFIAGGYIRGEPVLVTAQGTYEDMHLQGRRPDMAVRWTCDIPADAPGARGSHMCPVVDLNQDGTDELMWGERCIELDRGTELFCADRDAYRGHSDVVQPLWDAAAGRWRLYTARESDSGTAPRVVLFDDAGRRLWGDVDHGHMDMGWTARLGDDGRHTAMAIRIGRKTCGPDGRHHQDIGEFAWDALTGRPAPLPFSVYRTLPVDLNGDGRHELVRGIPGGDGAVLDGRGRPLGSVEGTVALAAKLCDHPGEQVFTYRDDGTVALWADADAHDSQAALERYAQPFYRLARRLTATGYNLPLLGGL